MLSIYIYKTETFELSTIFHVSIFLKFLNLIFFFLNIYTLISQTKYSSQYTSKTKHRTAEPKATVQGQNGRTSPFDKTKPSTSIFDITHQTQNIYTLSNTNPSYFVESLQGHDHGSQRFQSPTQPPYQSILSRYLSINL